VTARRPNLVFTRGGNESLHPLWLRQKDVARTWDLHVSYFGDKGAPMCAGEDGVSFTQDDARYKWGGMRVCLDKKPFNLDDYEYIAFPDDDLVVTTEGWNRAFALMKQYDLHAAQLALHPSSYYTINMTLQRPGTRLRYTNYVELMVPVARVEVFKHASQYFDDPQSSWGIDHVIGAFLKDKPNAMAMLDAAPALHTRAHGVSPMYKDMTKGGLNYFEQEAAFLARLGLSRVDRKTLGAIDNDGNPVADLTSSKRPLVAPRALRALRHFRKITRIVSINDDPAKIEHALRMVAPR
jgi:hypothetical protein